MRRFTFVATCASALLFPLALPNEAFPMGSPLLGLIALTPFYVALLRAGTPRRAALLGIVFGGVSTFIANYWLMFFGEYSVWTIGGTTLAYMLFNAILGPFLWTALRADRAYRPVLFALVWTAYEFLKSIGFLGYPWGLAAYPFNTLTLFIQIADVTGVGAITFIVIYLNGVLAEALCDLVGNRDVSPESRRNGVFVLILVALAAGYGWRALARDIPADGDLDLLLVQQNANSWDTRDLAGPLATSERLTRNGLAASEDPPDLIVWSETSLRFPYDEFRRWYDRNPPEEPFSEFVRQLPSPLLTGSPYRPGAGEFTIYNGALLIGPDGQTEQWYGKQHLVPFAEYVPFWESPVVQRFFREVVGIGAIWAPGPGYRLFTLAREDGDPVRAGTPICFEDSFAAIGRGFVNAGADLLINLTNNAWSQTNSAQLQHLVAARFRAVETRRSLVRSTNAGFTGVVDPWGRVTAGLPMFEEGFLRVLVPVYKPDTTPLYVAWGDYFPVTVIVLLLGLLIRSRARSRGRTARFPTNS